MEINYKGPSDVKFNSYSAQVPIEHLAIIGAQKQAKYESGLEQTKNLVDTFANIPSLPGADTDMKNKIISDLNAGLQKIGGQDFANPKVRGQIQSYINKYTESGDLAAIASRAYKAQELQDKYNELTKTGDTISPWDMAGLNEIQQYAQSGNYIKNKQFNGDVYKSVNFDKLYNETFKTMEANLIEQHALDPSWRNFDETRKGKSLESIKAATINAIKNDPQAYGSVQRMAQYGLQAQGKTPTQVYWDKLNRVYEVAIQSGNYADAIELENKMNALNTPGADQLANDWMVEDLIEQKAHAFGNAFQYQERTYKLNELQSKYIDQAIHNQEAEHQALIDRIGFTTEDGIVVPPKPETSSSINSKTPAQITSLYNELKKFADVTDSTYVDTTTEPQEEGNQPLTEVPPLLKDMPLTYAYKDDEGNIKDIKIDPSYAERDKNGNIIVYGSIAGTENVGGFLGFFQHEEIVNDMIKIGTYTPQTGLMNYAGKKGNVNIHKMVENTLGTTGPTGPMGTNSGVKWK